jgi:hypothetical protein
MRVRFTVRGGEIIHYSVVLLYEPSPVEGLRSIRVYDYSHGLHDEHLCDRRGQRGPARTFHHGTAKEGLAEAQRLIGHEYVTMISVWLAQPLT